MSSLEEFDSEAEEEEKRIEEQMEKSEMEAKLMNEPETIKNLELWDLIANYSKEGTTAIQIEDEIKKRLRQLIIDRIKELKHQWKDLKELNEHNMGIKGDMEKCRQLDAKIVELIRLGNIAEGDLK